MLERLLPRFAISLIALLCFGLALAACGDNNATVASTTLPAATPTAIVPTIAQPQPSPTTVKATVAPATPTAVTATATTPATTTTAPTGPVEINPGTPFQLKYGQSGLLKPDNLSLKFTTIGTDSRCPVSSDPRMGGVACVTDGQVEVWLEVRKGDQFIDSIKLIKRGSTYPTPVAYDIKGFENYTVQLLKVEPYPTISPPPTPNPAKPQPSEYVITLQVNKRS